MNRKKDIIKIINSISGKYSSYEVFCDWIRCCALAISNAITLNHNAVWKKREQEYIDTMNRYDLKERNLLVEIFVLLQEMLEYEMTDVLGQIYMEAGMGSKSAGQFFTPYHLSEVCAMLALPEADERGIIRLNEPSCGGGGMIIAAASALKRQGINYQRKLEVVAQDLDWKGVYMCYLQLSLLGIRAVCVQGDTLSEPYTGRGYPPERVLYTPGKVGLLI